MHIVSIGIDLGKTTFHLVALGERNKILLRRKFSRSHVKNGAMMSANPGFINCVLPDLLQCLHYC